MRGDSSLLASAYESGSTRNARNRLGPQGWWPSTRHFSSRLQRISSWVDSRIGDDPPPSPGTRVIGSTISKRDVAELRGTAEDE